MNENKDFVNSQTINAARSYTWNRIQHCLKSFFINVKFLQNKIETNSKDALETVKFQKLLCCRNHQESEGSKVTISHNV